MVPLNFEASNVELAVKGVIALPFAVMCPYLSMVIGYIAEVVVAGDVEGGACLIVTLPLVPLPVKPSLPVTPVIVPVLLVYPFGFVELYGVKPSAAVISELDRDAHW